jgi:NADPH-dependent 2,4-dienoyl-CoA reductase/sulfur reductase-like enzyme
MAHYRYLVIGGGMTADAAVHGIREVDADGSICLIGREPHPSYNRPPLSKKLWQGKPLESIWREPESRGVDLRLGREARVLDPRNRCVVDDTGVEFTWERLLLATGGTPRRLPVTSDRVIYFRTLDDYRALRNLADEGERFAVIGGGFIGSEIAAALTMNNRETIMLFPEEGICDRVFPRDISRFLTEYYRQKGVTLLAGEKVADVVDRGTRLVVKTAGGREIPVDGVVAGVGIEPEVDLARQAGIALGNGIIVDEFLRTSDPQIFAAGDVAEFHNPLLGKRMRVEHEDNANVMGKLAGRNMAGADEPYRHLPFFYSDLFELGYEAVGELDGRLETVADWQEPYRQGVVYYLHEERVRGVLLWNVWDQVDNARQLIAEPGPFTAETLKGRLPR